MTHDPLIFADVELLSICCAIEERVADYFMTFGYLPVFLHVSPLFLARWCVTNICFLGVLVDPELRGLSFYLRKEP